MNDHKGMRPQDVVILLKIATLGEEQWYAKDIAAELGISNSEVSVSLERSVLAGLLSPDKRSVMSKALLKFLQYGLPHVFPQLPGALQRGVPTAVSAPILAKHISSDVPFVWPHPTGKVRGQGIIPLHKNVPLACERDPKLYDLLALVDTLRIGRVREKELANRILAERLA